MLVSQLVVLIQTAAARTASASGRIDAYFVASDLIGELAYLGDLVGGEQHRGVATGAAHLLAQHPLALTVALE